MTRMGSGHFGPWTRFVPIAIALAIGIAQTGCALPLLPVSQTLFTGHIYGDSLVTAPVTAQTALPSPVPLRATIACNAAATTADADGAYNLAVDQADEYSCTISAATYVPVTITIAARAGTHVRLDLGAGTATPGTPVATPTVMPSPATATCTNLIVTPAATCPPLHLETGVISGVVTSADTQQPVSYTQVACFQPTLPGQPRAPSQTTRTTYTGAFSIAAMPAGLYDCVAEGDPTLHAGVLQPLGVATVVIQVCGRHCPPVRFHNGEVMHDMTAYLIFWLPPGHSFEPAGSDTRFESLMAQYMTDVGGSALYGLLTQYWDFQGTVVNDVTLGGTYVDTTAYPHAGTRADPLSSDDIENEIEQDVRATSWMVDGEHEVFIFTGYNVESCASSGRTRGCSFSTNGRDYCAYHSDFPTSVSIDHAIYAYLPVLSDCVQIEELSTSGSPNHDVIADAVIDSLSHEHFESVSDPHVTGWYGSDPSEDEIGDKCAYRFGTIRPDGSNVTLSHGHIYLVQEEWSDRAGGCALQ